MTAMKNLLYVCFFCCWLHGMLHGNTSVIHPSVVEGRFRLLENLAFKLIPGSTTRSQTATACCLECAKFESCNAVNYLEQNGDCEMFFGYKMNFVDPEAVLVARPGWRVYERIPCGLGYKSGRHCHHMIALSRNWTGAANYCSGLGEILPEVFNQQEMDDLISDFIATGWTSVGYFWLGLNTNSMQWSSGAPATFTYWSPNNGAYGGGQCIFFYINHEDAHGWIEYRCNATMYFICEIRNE